MALYLDPEKYENLILDYLDYADSIAGAYCKRHSFSWDWIDELKSAARLGLVEAAFIFDPKYGPANFRSYSYKRIKGRIIDELGFIFWAERTPDKERVVGSYKWKAPEFEYPGDSPQMWDRLASFDESSFDRIAKKFDLLYLLSHGKKVLNSKEMRVLIGLLQGKLLKVIGEEMGLTESWACMVLKRVVGKVKKMVLDKRLFIPG